MQVLGSGDGAVALEATPGEQHVTEGDGPLHGGVIATMLDVAGTFALIDASGSDWSTVDMRVDFLRPAPTGRLRVTGIVLQAGTRVGRARAELSDPATGRVLAGAVGMFIKSGPVTS